MFLLKCNRIIKRFFFLIVIYSILSCSAFIKAPTGQQSSTLGEVTAYTQKLKALPEPKEKVVVAVYKFKDQTGQYKASENNANWSTAIPQGTTSILLKALEDSKWFTTIERENISDLLNERQIIKSTRQEYATYQNQNANPQPLPPLLFAGIILEGGIVSYDTNIMTGGAGLRYFGVGGGTQYRQDRISVYLRAVSTNNGKILKTIYTSKTILSQSINGNFFRYVDPDRLLEAEIGITKNEPVHLAVKEAIEKAVYTLIIEGSTEKLWDVSTAEEDQFKTLAHQLIQEDSINNLRVDNRVLLPRRGKFSINASARAYTIKGDLRNSETNFGFQVGAKMFLSQHFNINASFSNFKLSNADTFLENFYSVDADLEFVAMPNDNVSPFIYGGVGMLQSHRNDSSVRAKANVGLGIEFLPIPSVGLRAFGEYDFGFNDDWDHHIGGKRKDHLITYGIGIQYYFGKKINPQDK